MENGWWWLFWIAVIGMVVLAVVRIKSRSFEPNRYRSRGAAGRRTAAGTPRETGASGRYTGRDVGLERTTRPEPADRWIEQEVRQRLAASGDLRGSNLTVEAHAGHLTLRGTVPSSSQRDEAAGIAGRVAGVYDIDNRIQVGG